MDLDQLRALAAVVDYETFEAAAGELRLTPSAVSQRIKKLERSVGCVLVRRLKPVRPTPAGEQLLRPAHQLLLLADEAVFSLRGSGPAHGQEDGTFGEGTERLRVPIVANADSIATWLPAAIRDIALGGRVALELLRDDEHATADLLRSGGAIGAVTADPRPVQGCTVRPLGTMIYRAKASQEFVDRWFPDGPTPMELAVAPVMQFDRKDTHQLAASGASRRRRHPRSTSSPTPSSSSHPSTQAWAGGWCRTSRTETNPSWSSTRHGARN